MNLRILSIDFDQYTHGDHDFKIELVGLMINNLRELQESLGFSVLAKDMTDYRRACHKVNSTISILGDIELQGVMEDIKKNPDDSGKVALFNRISNEIINSLRFLIPSTSLSVNS